MQNSPSRPRALPQVLAPDLGEPSILLVTHEDFSPEQQFAEAPAFPAVLAVADPELLWGEGARRFVKGAAADYATRVAAHFKCPAAVIERLDAETLAAAARAAGVRQIVTLHAPVGPAADALAAISAALAVEGVRLVQVRRSWDEAFWPHARKGFFTFKEHIPQTLRELGIA